jgi:hypothetical protein
MFWGDKNKIYFEYNSSYGTNNDTNGNDTNGFFYDNSNATGVLYYQAT